MFEAVIYDTDPDPLASVPHRVDGHDVQAQVGQVGSEAGVLLQWLTFTTLCSFVCGAKIESQNLPTVHCASCDTSCGSCVCTVTRSYHVPLVIPE